MSTTASRQRLLPPLDGGLIVTILIAGTLAVLSWELWARLATPLLIGAPLDTASLVQSVLGLHDRTAAEAIHGVVGLLLYPLSYLFVARPLQRLMFPDMSVVLTGAFFGVALWVFALYAMAHLMAGYPAFFGFIPLTWASLAGHVLFGVAIAAVVRFREGEEA
ncbi:MAG TPA: hypothetical protein VMP03_02650 [Methylomirabilota bacterium]|nr:hypothetical protein [Methylomirabilota bacterium]